MNSGLIEKYRKQLPIGSKSRVISLNEGGTPLIELNRLPKKLSSLVQIFCKFEGMNPTGSFKDRGMTLAVTRAVEKNSSAVMCASTGNTSASAAAYAARAGIACFVLIPEGKIATGKLAQAVMHGAEVIQIKGNFDDGLRLVRELSVSGDVEVVNSINPYRLQGQKTIAFEIIEAIGVPDYHVLPVGNAGNIAAHWIGYSEATGQHCKSCNFCSDSCPFLGEKLSSRRPTLVGYQASGAAPFLRGSAVKNPETIATAIRIGNPASWDLAKTACSESGGWFGECSDEEIIEAQKMLAEYEGLFCEPASAITIAGLIKDVDSGKIPKGSKVVCTLTGHGLKDPEIAMQSHKSMHVIEATRTALDTVIKKNYSK